MQEGQITIDFIDYYTCFIADTSGSFGWAFRVFPIHEVTHLWSFISPCAREWTLKAVFQKSNWQ